MKKTNVIPLNTSDGQSARRMREEQRQSRIPNERLIENRSGIEIKPLYTSADRDGSEHLNSLSYPGQAPMTGGIHPAMHRGRTWGRRQLIGPDTPDYYNERPLKLIGAGTAAISLIPCDSADRGHDFDESRSKIDWNVRSRSQ